jgi:hypothetical protein
MVCSFKSFIALFILLMIGLPIFGSLVPVSAQEVFDVQLGPLNPQEQTVTVTPSSIGSASFVGEVTVQKPPVREIVANVDLDGSCSSGWSTVVSPQSIPFEEAGSVQYTVVVVVPQATPSYHVCNLKVEAIMTYPGGQDNDTTGATVYVEQYYRIEPTSPGAFQDDNPVEFKLDIYNRGNGPDTFRVEFDEKTKALESKFKMKLDKTTTSEVPIDLYETVTLTVSFENKDVEDRKAYYFALELTSLGAQSAGLTVSKKFVFSLMARTTAGRVADDILYHLIEIIIIIVVLVIVSIVVMIYRKRRKFRHRPKED